MEGKGLIPVRRAGAASKGRDLRMFRHLCLILVMAAALLLLPISLVPQPQARQQAHELTWSLLIEDLAGARDDDHAFEELYGRMNCTLRPIGGRQGSRAWNFMLSWRRGSFLYYPWFFNLADLKGNITARGIMSAQTIRVEEALLESPVIEARARGLILKQAESGAVPKDTDALNGIGGIFSKKGRFSAKGSLGPLFDILVRDAFSFEHPLVQRFSAEGELELTADRHAARLYIEGDIDYEQAPLLSELKAALAYPLSGAGPDGEGDEEACLPGRVSWASLDMNRVLKMASSDGIQGASIGLMENQIPLTICRDSVAAGPAGLIFPEGSLRLKNVIYRFGKKQSQVPLEIRSITLADIVVNELIPGIPWRLVIDSPNLDAMLQERRLVFQGHVDLHLAGGIVRFDNIWFEPFGVIPRYGADIAFSGIDLEELTAPTGFGRVTGRIKGWIKGLVMSRMQPEAFDMLIVSDPEYRGPKEISIKAIENLAILGGGSGGRVPILGAFFKNFAYSRIGISCRLKNDVFELHGLTKKGGVEYLVERGFFGGVNVVNMNPEGKILFADMVERLKRITSTEFEKMEVR